MRTKPQNSSSRFRCLSGAKGVVAVAAMLMIVTAAEASESATPAALTHRNAQLATEARPSSPPPSATVTIPAETEVATELLSGIHTQVSQVGDTVTARLSKPLYINGRLTLPLGTLLDGRITRIRAAGRMHRPAELALRFEWIALPDGQAEPVWGVLAALENRTKTRLDAEGYLKGAPSFAWKGLAGGALALSALALSHGALGGSAAFRALLPAGGASLLALAFVWRRGSDVHVPPETLCRVRLVYPVTVRVEW